MSKESKSSSPGTYTDPEDVRVGETVEETEHDAVFGEITKDGPNYRNVCI